MLSFFALCYFTPLAEVYSDVLMILFSPDVDIYHASPGVLYGFCIVTCTETVPPLSAKKRERIQRLEKDGGGVRRYF